MPKIPSRVFLSIIAMLSGMALTYRLMAWGLLPILPENVNNSMESNIAGVIMLLVLGGLWVAILRRRPK